jgi:hypothetical protein
MKSPPGMGESFIVVYPVSIIQYPTSAFYGNIPNSAYAVATLLIAQT